MSCENKVTKFEWAWVHSTGKYNISRESNMTKIREAYYGESVAGNTRSRTHKRMFGKDEILNSLRAEERANRERLLFPLRRTSFLNYRKVCEEVKNAAEKRKQRFDCRKWYWLYN